MQFLNTLQIIVPSETPGLNITDGVTSGSFYQYDGTPEGNVTASNGSICLDVNSGALYVKTSGASNTGWLKALTTALQKYTTLIGDGIATSFVLTHGFNNTEVSITVYEVSTGEEIIVDNTRNSSTQVTIGPFTSTPTSNQYRVVIFGINN